MGNAGTIRAESELQRLRRALEAETQRCAEIQSQLDRANADFEEFLATAAHDLLEALRDVVSFSQLMAENSAGQFDSDFRHYDAEAAICVERIRGGAARMQSLLADVQAYWCTSGEPHLAQTDMEAVLRQALLFVDKEVTERNAIVTHDPLPEVSGDFEILTKIMQHLVRNAIEYCDTPAPRVHISCRRADPDWEFSVQDNGPGIAPEFQSRIFSAFKRLHGKEHPGSGLGLAYCKKAIERLGGRLRMESAPGNGSIFYFTLTSAD